LYERISLVWWDVFLASFNLDTAIYIVGRFFSRKNINSF
jgi:hypothetical protein